MELIELTSKSELNSFVLTEHLQSFEWGEILKAEGEEIRRVGLKKEGRLVAAATLVKKNIGAGFFYWYAPRGPIFLETQDGLAETERFFYQAIMALDAEALFLRVEPEKIPPGGPDVRKSLDLQPAQTLILDLSQGLEDLRADLSQKTRYNIRLAEKKGVKVKPGGAADFPEFRRLLDLTGRRDNFRLHGWKHYENLLSGEPGFIRLYLAEYEGKNIAAGLFCFWGNKVTYLHGASDNEFRNVMAPYLLQWSVIGEAINAGYRFYDFYGIDEKKWPGVTRFKIGFGGESQSYPGTYDIVFRPKLYAFYNFLRRLRRLI